MELANTTTSSNSDHISDGVWHEGRNYKVKCIGVTGLKLDLIQSFLSHRFQRVVLNGKSSTSLPVAVGVRLKGPFWGLSFS